MLPHHGPDAAVLRRGARFPNHRGDGPERVRALFRRGAPGTGPAGVGGVELGSREPIFDIVVSAEKKSTFSRLAQNETAKECYQLGFFAPRNADAALAALEMMDFEGIEKVRQRVRQNGTLAQRLEQLQSQLVQLKQGPLSGPGENLSTAAAARAMKGAVS